jgi:hypothetical protein
MGEEFIAASPRSAFSVVQFVPGEIVIQNGFAEGAVEAIGMSVARAVLFPHEVFQSDLTFLETVRIAQSNFTECVKSRGGIKK